jgi:hypothetical protein
VFEDSPGDLRSRDSLGNDVVTGPGGIVWTQAGSGLLHEETPADPDRELHGLQVFVNLSSNNKLAAPQMPRKERGAGVAESCRWDSHLDVLRNVIHAQEILSDSGLRSPPCSHRLTDLHGTCDSAAR